MAGATRTGGIETAWFAVMDKLPTPRATLAQLAAHLVPANEVLAEDSTPFATEASTREKRMYARTHGTKRVNPPVLGDFTLTLANIRAADAGEEVTAGQATATVALMDSCLLYTSPSPRDS